MLFATLAWGVSPILIRLIRDAYDPWTQTFLRYAVASVVLSIFCLFTFRQQFLALLRDPRPVLGIALLNTAAQYLWTAGCYGVESTVANLITKLTVIFVIILSFVLYHEERRVVTSPLYLFGTAISLAGVTLVLMRDPGSFRADFNVFTIMLLVLSFLWGVYFVWGKHIVGTLHPIPMFAVVAIISTGMFAVAVAVFEEPAGIAAAGTWAFGIAALAGLTGVATAHPSFHFAQKHLGSAFCTSITLANPLATYLIALVLLPDERLIATQIAGALIIIAGTYAVTRAEQRT